MKINLSNVDAIGILPVNDAIRLLKKQSSKQLIKIIHCVADNAESQQTRLWTVASRALSELYLRKYSQEHPKIISKLKTLIENKGHVTTVDPLYAMESAGIQKSGRILRPYPRSKTAKKVMEKWHKSKTGASFDTYFKKHLSHHTKKQLQASKVHYLSKDERKKYEVAFENGSILIGGKTPHDGEYIFCLDSNGEQLCAGKKKKGVLQHTSFFAAKPVQAAGVFDIKKGTIKKIHLSSGHYKPTLEKDGKKIVEFLTDASYLGEKAAKKLSIVPGGQG